MQLDHRRSTQSKIQNRIWKIEKEGIEKKGTQKEYTEEETGKKMTTVDKRGSKIEKGKQGRNTELEGEVKDTVSPALG